MDAEPGRIRRLSVIRATVKGFQRFESVTADIEALCLAALDEAALEAAAVAQSASSVPLEIEVLPAEIGVESLSAGIVSGKRGKTGVRIALFFDSGTLAGRTRKLKRPRRDHWSVRRGGTAYTAYRKQIEAGEGIPAERFFSRARSAGRKVLLARIDRGADAVRFFGR